MSHRHIYLFWGLLFLLPTYCHSQIIKWDFEVMEMPGGSAGNKVAYIAQDSMGYLWFASAGGIHRYDGHEFKTFLNDPLDSTSLADNYVDYLFVDKKGTLWIGPQTGGLQYYHPDTESFSTINLKPDKTTGTFDSWIQAIAEDTAGIIWVGTTGAGLFRVNPETHEVKNYVHNPLDSTSLTYDEIGNILVDKSGTLWVCTGWYPSGRQKGGLNRYHPEIDGFERFQHDSQDPNSLEENVVWSAFEDSQNNFWVGTSGDGLHLMDRPAGKFDHLHFDPGNPNKLSAPHSRFPLLGASEHVGVRRIFEDRDGYLWFVSFDNGLVVYHPPSKKVFRYQNAAEGGSNAPDILPSRSFWAIAQTKDGSLWLGGGRPGQVLKALPVYQSFQYINLADEITFHEVSAIMEDHNENIWVGTYGFGLYLYNRVTGKMQRLVNQSGNSNSLSGNSIWSIFEDSKGYIWIGTFNSGLNRYDPRSGNFQRFTYDDRDSTSISDIFIGSISEDHQGNIWIGSTNNGLNLFDSTTSTFRRFIPNTPNPISGTDVKAIFTDSQNRLWAMGGNGMINLTTLRGSGFIDRWNPKNKAFEPILSGKQEEVLGRAVMGMVEDQKGMLWFFSQEGGLHKFNPDLKTVEFYNPSKGNFPDWNIHWLVSDKDGTFWIGTREHVYHFNPLDDQYQRYDIFSKHPGSNIFNNAIYGKSDELIFNWGSGFYIFHPKQFEAIARNQISPKILFSHIEISSPDTNETLHKTLFRKERIALSYRQNTFSIGLRNLHFMEPSANRVEFLLEPYVDKWRLLPENQLAEFLAVPPGTYTLRAKGFSSEGLQSEEIQLSITIAPPWWRTRWAYIIYILSGVMLLMGVYFYQRRRWQLQTELQVEQEKAHRLKELDHFKSRFYTNITHEFRTPLTVIQGMSEQIKGNEKIKTLINRNSDRLLTMVNQLLNLSRLETKSMSINWVQGDIVSYLKYLTESCHSLAASKNLQLTFVSTEDQLLMDFDEDKLQQILINLLSNAIKFTPEHGSVKVVVKRGLMEEKEHLELAVVDTGYGISKKALPEIFNRFYQVDSSTTRSGEGSGIGLALVKELVDLLKGQIEVLSEVGKGSEFTVLLPIDQNAPLQDNPIISPPLSIIQPTVFPNQPLNPGFQNNGEKPLILIVEDNQDVVAYIHSCVQENYEVRIAANGKLGVEIALTIIPDVIICDVMMPEMDGFAVCQHLKSSKVTSHIPIIMLTAKATQEDKLIGLTHGADVYLTKPFHREELLVRIRNLSLLSLRLREALSIQERTTDSFGQLQKQEAAFLEELRQIIESNMANEDFNTQHLCRAIAMSRTQLHRKLKALSGQATAHYIRSIRLQKAKTLLKETNLSIGEIVSEVGFKDFSHFSQTFLKEFGVQPSKFRQN